MVVSTKLYDILGVDSNADDATIKKAYRKKAMKYHPDRHSSSNDVEKKAAEDKFKEISSAYEVLSDQRKRQIYDQLGDEGIQQAAAEAGMEGHPFNMSDLIGNLFGGFPGMRKDNRQPVKQDTMAELSITLEEAYLGCTKTIQRKWHKRCDICNGRGVGDPSNIINCKPCNGRGSIIETHQMGHMIMQQQRPCHQCRGRGKFIKPGSECNTCKGEKVIQKDIQHEIRLPAGARNGYQAKFIGEGDWNPEWSDNQPIGDMVINIRIVYNKDKCPYKLEGDHLALHKAISLCDALRGMEFGVKTMDGRKLLIKNDKMLQTGDCLIVKDEGMPIIEGPNAGGRGDLRIYIRVVYPHNRSVNNIADKDKINKTMKLLFRDDPTTAELDGRFHDKIGLPIPSIPQTSNTTIKTTTTYNDSNNNDWDTPVVEHIPAVDSPNGYVDENNSYSNNKMNDSMHGPRSMADGGEPQCVHQ